MANARKPWKNKTKIEDHQDAFYYTLNDTQ